MFEESPLNRYLREQDAQKLYNQAIDFYENKDYGSAIKTLSRLTSEGYRGFWGHYYDTECARSAQADQLYPFWNCEWAEELYADGKIGEAVGRLKMISSEYPEYQNEFIVSRIRDMEIDSAKRAPNSTKITLPEGTSKDLDEYSELIIINDSPKQINIYLRGPVNMSITIDANNESTYRIIPPLLSSSINRDVKETLTLPSGKFEMSIEAHLAILAYGEFTLLRNRSYELFFYILEQYG